MTIVHIHVPDETMEYLKRASRETGRSIENLAEAAVDEAALQYDLHAALAKANEGAA